MDAAKLLAEEVHRDIQLDERETSLLPHDLIETYENIGIWIDPIGMNFIMKILSHLHTCFHANRLHICMAYLTL